MKIVTCEMKKTTTDLSSLRSYYLQLKPDYAEGKKSGSGGLQRKIPSWPYYESLSFLIDSTLPRKTLSNMNSP